MSVWCLLRRHEQTSRAQPIGPLCADFVEEVGEDGRAHGELSWSVDDRPDAKRFMLAAVAASE
jgi:hypothetical protein